MIAGLNTLGNAHHHIRDLQQQGIIVTEGVESRQMAADGLTKILRTDAFNQFLSLIGLTGRD